MNIIIVGSGAVGATICGQLAKEGHNIVVIDTDEGAINEISNSSDVTGIIGNGADISVLREAGAEDADLLIAVTNGDEVNILCCYAAKKLGTLHTVARVRNPEYNDLLTLTGDDMGISMTVNPEHTVATQIARILKFPSATRLDTFCGGRVELAEFTVSKKSAICGASLYNIRKALTSKFLVCSVRRGEEIYIPNGDFVIEEGDDVCITASEEEMVKFFKEEGSYKRPANELLIVGGGRTTYYLGELLKKTHINVVAIEKDRRLCRELAEEFSFTVINANGTNQDLLIEEGIESTDAFLALTDEDEENAIVSMFAKTKKVPKIITMIRSLPYIDFFRGVGIESIVSPKFATAEQIIKFVRSLDATHDSEIESLHRIMGSEVEALEFTVKEPVEGITGIPLKDLKKKKNTIIACIIHEGNIIIPSGSDIISSGDSVIVICVDKKMMSIKDII